MRYMHKEKTLVHQIPMLLTAAKKKSGKFLTYFSCEVKVLNLDLKFKYLFLFYHITYY